jgi:uncharacterized lipoprotein YmbA
VGRAPVARYHRCPGRLSVRPLAQSGGHCHATPGSAASRRIVVDIDAVDIGADGRCLVAARWRVSAVARSATGESRYGTFGEAAASLDDQAIALAMTRAIDQLAARIAATITGD